MNRDTFLHALWDHLVGRMPPQEVDRIMRHYAQRFDSAPPEREEEIARELGDPKALADRVVTEWAMEQDVPMPPAIRRQGPSVGKILLGIFVGIPVAVATIPAAVGVLVGTVACLAAGVACVLGGFSVLFSSGLFTAIYFMGGGFLSAGIGLLMGAAALAVGRLGLRFVGYCFRGGERA